MAVSPEAAPAATISGKEMILTGLRIVCARGLFPVDQRLVTRGRVGDGLP